MGNNNEDKLRALDAALGQIEKQYGKGAVMKLGDSNRHNRLMGKNKKEKDTSGSQNKSPVRCYLNSQSGFGNRNNPADKPQHSRQL